jgi:hypothetical protein
MDGVCLDESVWALAQPATDFFQQQPGEGAPASERTEVRVLFDDRNIYSGRCSVDDGLGATLAARTKVLWTS